MELVSFKENCKRIFELNCGLPTPTEDQIEKLFALTKIMLEVNKSMNLTAITEENAIILKHYADSVSISEYIPQGASVIDVGCGAGFPSLPLAIFRPDLKITSLDGTAKRIEYVRKTAQVLGLSNINAVAARAEEYVSENGLRETFDVATARAVANLPVLSELCLPFVKKNGLFIAMKASQGEKEIQDAANAISLCGGALEETRMLELTENGIDVEKRVIAIIIKKKPTPDKYPRHYSQITKKPL